MDGTLADLSSAYAEVEERLFGAADEEAKHPAPKCVSRSSTRAEAAAAAVVVNGAGRSPQ